MDLSGAGVAERLHDLAGGGAPHDGVVHDHHALAADRVRQRVELQPDASLAKHGGWLDERPPDVAVLHEALAVRDAGSFGVPLSGGVRCVRDGDHHVGRDGSLGGQAPPHLLAGLVQAPAVHPRVGPAQVHEFEQAQGRPG